MDPFKPYQPRPRQSGPPKLSHEDAQAVALKALAFIVADDDSLLPGFVSASGCGLEDVRDRLAEDGFLGAVLDFLLSDDQAVIAFAAAEGLHPETAMLARLKLA